MLLPSCSRSQVLTAAKRAEIRARTEDSARQIQEAKRTNMRLIEDRDEMLAAAEAIPVPSRQAPPAAATGAGQEARVNGDQRNDRRRSWQQAADGGDAGTAAAEAEAEDTRGDGGGSPLTAWIYDCYNHDDYPGHVSDIRKFLSGIDIDQVPVTPTQPLQTPQGTVSSTVVYFLRARANVRAIARSWIFLSNHDFGLFQTPCDFPVFPGLF